MHAMLLFPYSIQYMVHPSLEGERTPQNQEKDIDTNKGAWQVRFLSN